MSPVLAGSTFIRPHLNIGYGNNRQDGVKNLTELVEFAAQNNPDHIFGQQLRANDATNPCIVTFSQLASAVERAAAWLVAVGATKGRTKREDKIPPVAILLGSDISIFIYMCALLRIGTPALILSARLTPVAIAHLLKRTNPTAVLTSNQVSRSTNETLALFEAEKPEGFTVPQFFDAEKPEGFTVPQFFDAVSYEDFLNPTGVLAEYPVPPKYTNIVYEDLDALVLHSSGTTGLPKPIYHSQTYPLLYAACHRLPEQKDPFRYSASTLPLYHGFGHLAPMLSLSIGLPFVLPPASIIPTGKTTLAMLKSSSARFLLSVPSILEDILRLPGKAGLEVLQELEVIAIGGAAVKENVGNELVENGVNLLNHWGATEIGPIAPIERIPRGYDWHYLMPRTDMGLRFVPLDDGSNTFRLYGRAPGWTEDYIVQDLLVANPAASKQYKILGRADDLLVLATGEKVRPTNMERAVAEHPDVKDVLAYGEGQASLGLIVEMKAASTWDINDPDAVEALRTSLDPFLEKGNSFTDAHGKVTREMLIFTREDTRRLLRTDKGSINRKANYAQFDKEIKETYELAELLNATPLPSPSVDGGAALLAAVRNHVQAATHAPSISPENDDLDFFEGGMDSLQATRLRRAIQNGLKVTQGLPVTVTELESDFVFENSSVTKLYNAVKQVMQGTYGSNDDTRESKRIRAMEEMVEKYRQELATYSDIAAEARAKRKAHSGEYDSRKVVLLTGSSGSLGCFLLARIASDESVRRVYCLNRPTSGVDARQRQISLMEKRGAVLRDEHWEKVQIIEAELSKPDFGLGEKYNELVGITHVIHNAWPVNFNRNLSSFEPHIKALSNLFRLSIQSSGTRPANSEPGRVLFASSIAVASHFRALNPEGPLEVPEDSLDAATCAEFGYPEAKWVCERVTLAADEQYGQGAEPLVKGSNVRIGQMTGAVGSGSWNESEHFPLIVHSSAALKVVPALTGSLSWIPVNVAGDAITEMLFSKGFRKFYHMENPSRQSWEGLVANLASILGGSEPLPTIPFDEWLEKVKAAGEEKNPAYRVFNFLKNDFIRLSSGHIILRTAETKLDSPALVKSTALDRKHLEEYIAYWRKVGAMQ